MDHRHHHHDCIILIGICLVGLRQASGDGLWQAGAIEGYIASVLVMNAWGLPLEEYLGREKEISKALVSLVDEKSNEALTLLGKDRC